MPGTGASFDVAAYLAEPDRPAQVAAVSPAGLPLLGSLWFVYQDSRFWFSTRAGAPLLRAITFGSEVAVLVDEFSPPSRIRQVRIRGRGVIEPDDAARVESIYQRYLGGNLDAWPDVFKDRVTDAQFALWSVTPTTGFVVDYANFEADEVRWSDPTQSPLSERRQH